MKMLDFKAGPKGDKKISGLVNRRKDELKINPEDDYI